MLQALAAAGLALVVALPNLAVETGNRLFADFELQNPVDDALRDCLKAAHNDYSSGLDGGRREFSDAVEAARLAHKQAMAQAWQTRETAIRTGRVTIAMYDDSGRERENRKAERAIFETAKSTAETEYENAKKAASAAWRTDYRSAAEAWDAARKSLLENLKGGKDNCLKAAGR